MTLASGTRLGPYEITGALGAGGMGEVYRARDSRLGRDVAIKVLPAHVAASPELRARFDREARTISQINHPHICTLFDVGHQDGVDFLVMELLEGETLAHRLERGPLPPEELLRRATEIADALDKAHRQGLIHRDLKPANIMLTKSGAKLLDFGLARAVENAEGGSSSGGQAATIALTRTPTLTRALTAAGSIVGTYQYMAPEVLEGKDADPRSDIWSLGATLYEMATGKRAFEAGSQASLIASIMKERPRAITEIQPLLAPGLERAIERCLEKDPDERWQSARDLLSELRWLAEGGSRAGIPAPVAAKRRQRDRALTAVAAASTVAAVALGAYVALHRPPAPPLVRFELQPASSVQFQDAPRVSPDGRMLAYSATDSAGKTLVWIRRLESRDPVPIPGTDGAGRPFWSPDSRSLAFFSDGKLKRVDVAGGPAVAICDAPTGSDGTWSRSGTILFDGAAADPIRRVPASGGIPAAEVLPDTVHHYQVGWPQFVDDGKHFIYMNIGETSHIMGAAVGAKERHEIGPADSRCEMASGHLLYMRGGSLLVQRFDSGAMKLAGDPSPIAEAVRPGGNGGADFSVSQTGVLTYVEGAPPIGRFVWMSRDGRETVLPQPDQQMAGFLNPALSPDQRRAAVRVLDRRSGTRDIWIYDLVRGASSRFTFEPSNENNPLWSPDGDQLAYVSTSTDAPGIHIRSASGSGSDRLLLRATNQPSSTCWTHDGSTIFYTTFPSGSTSEIWTVSVADGKPTPFLQPKAYFVDEAQLSPDGHWLAYTSSESGRPEVFVQSYPDKAGKWQISTAGGYDPKWRADSKELFYLSNDSKLMSVTFRTTPSFEADIPKPLFTAHVLVPGPNVRTHYEPSPDGQRFLLVCPEDAGSAIRTEVVLNWPEAIQTR